MTGFDLLSYRKEADITRVSLAKTLKTSPSNIQYWERTNAEVPKKYTPKIMEVFNKTSYRTAKKQTINSPNEAMSVSAIKRNSKYINPRSSNENDVNGIKDLLKEANTLYTNNSYYRLVYINLIIELASLLDPKDKLFLVQELCGDYDKEVRNAK